MMRAALGRVGDRAKTPPAPQASNGRGQRPPRPACVRADDTPSPHDLRRPPRVARAPAPNMS